MANDVNVRALALDSLMEIERGTRNASEVMQTTLQTYQYLDKKDRSFYTRLCQGTLEYQLRLDYYLNQVSKTPMNKCKPYIRNLLRMSLYQLMFLDRVKKEAVCNEAVKLAKKRGYVQLSGFVNGVLRNLLRKQEKLSLPERPVGDRKQLISYFSILYSVPEWLVEQFLHWYPEEVTEGILAAYLNEMPLTLRVNENKVSVEALKASLSASGIQVQDGRYCPNTIQISEYNYIRRLEEFRKGYVTVQDESSCLQGYLLPVQKLREDSLILDICAAPGGKTMYAAEQLEKRFGAAGSGRVLARDVSEKKVERIRENVERMGYTRIEAEVQDALVYDDTLKEQVDFLMADVPCSGLGVIGRKKDIKYRLEQTQLAELVSLQREILTVTVPYLKQGGYLIYSTCTLNPEENEAQVSWLKNQFNLESVSIREELPKRLVTELEEQPHTNLEEGYCTLIPGKQQCDGFFLAKLRRC